MLQALLLLVLAGCTGVAQPSCTRSDVTDVPVSDWHGFVATTASINGTPVPMLVDTGAERVLVTPQAAATLRLPPDPHGRTRVRGTGGVRLSQNALIADLRVGGMATLDQSVAVSSLPGESATKPPAGLLGADWLVEFDMDLDLPHGRIGLQRLTCAPDLALPPGATRIQLYNGALVLVPVHLNGTTVTAVLDSGANRSVLGLAAATRAGLMPADLARDPKATTGGVDGNVQLARVHRFADLRVGNGPAEDTELLVAPLGLPMADMLLGADWMRRHRVWVSYAGRWISVRPPGQE